MNFLQLAMKSIVKPKAKMAEWWSTTESFSSLAAQFKFACVHFTHTRIFTNLKNPSWDIPHLALNTLRRLIWALTNLKWASSISNLVLWSDENFLQQHEVLFGVKVWKLPANVKIACLASNGVLPTISPLIKNLSSITEYLTFDDVWSLRLLEFMIKQRKMKLLSQWCIWKMQRLKRDTLKMLLYLARFDKILCSLYFVA